jgi:hypothetical protein
MRPVKAYLLRRPTKGRAVLRTARNSSPQALKPASLLRPYQSDRASDLADEAWLDGSESMSEPESRPIPIWGATKCSGRLTRRATSVTPAEIAGRTYYPYERCTRWTGGLQATGRRMLGASQRIFRAYRGRSTQSACVGLFDARSPSCAGVNQSNLDQAAAEQVGPVDLRIIGS